MRLAARLVAVASLIRKLLPGRRAAVVTVARDGSRHLLLVVELAKVKARLQEDLYTEE